MAVYVSNGDLILSTSAAGWYRSEEFKLLGDNTAYSTPLSPTVPLYQVLAFANNCNLLGVFLSLGSSSNFPTDRGVRVRLQEVRTPVVLDLSADTVTYATHGLNDNDEVIFATTGALPTGLTSGTTYYVVNSLVNTFQVSTAIGGSPVNMSGTQSGVHSVWVTRASVTRTAAELAPMGTPPVILDALIYFPLTPYAVTTTASTWRLAVDEVGGTTTGNWYVFYQDVTKLIMLRICVTDFTTGKPGPSDCAVIKDTVTMDEAWTLGNQEDVALNTWSMILPVGGVFQLANPPASPLTLTCTGTVLIAGGTFQAGSELSRIPVAKQFTITFVSPGTGKRYGFYSAFHTEVVFRNGICGKLYLYGENPTYPKVKLASNANSGQKNLVCDTDVSSDWNVGDTIDVLGTQYYNGGNAYVEHHVIASFAGATIVTTTNLAYTHTAGYSVVRRMKTDYGIVVNLALNDLFGQMDIVLKGVYLSDATFSLTNVAYAVWAEGNLILDHVFYDASSGGHLSVSELYTHFSTISITDSIFYWANFYGTLTTFRYVSGVIFDRNVVYDCFAQNAPAILLDTTVNFASDGCEISDGGHSGASYGGAIELSGAAKTVISNLKASSVGYVIKLAGAYDTTLTNITGDWIGNCFLYFSTNCVLLRCTGSIIAPTGGVTVLAEFVAGAYIYDSCVYSQTGALTVSTTNQTELLSGSRLGVHAFLLANDHRNYKAEGTIVSTGDGLTDTTVHTAGAGKFALRFEPISSANNLTWTFAVPTGDIQGRTMTVACWVKINNAAYYAGTHQKPRLTVRYDNATDAYAEATATTDWQLLAVNISPATTYGQITVTLSGRTDATGVNAYFYVDDFAIIYPAGYSLNLGGLDNWADALPVVPPIDTVLSAEQVWTVQTATLTGAGSIGKLLVDNVDAPISGRAAAGDAMILTAAYDRAKTALALSEYTAPPSAATIADAVLDEAASGHTGVIAVNLDAAVSTRSSHSAADVKTAIEADGSKLDHLWEMTEDDDGVRRLTANALEEAPSGTGLDAAGVRGAIGLAEANLDAQLDALPTAAENAASVWTYAARVLTSTAASTMATVTGSAISIQRGDTTSISLTGLGNISTRTKLWFTIKDSVQDHDAQSKVMVRENVGLIYVNGMTPTQAGLAASDAALNVTDETTGAVTIVLSAMLTAMLTPDTGLVYDIQMLTASGVTTLTSSTATVVGDVTQAIS